MQTKIWYDKGSDSLVFAAFEGDLGLSCAMPNVAPKDFVAPVEVPDAEPALRTLRQAIEEAKNAGAIPDIYKRRP